jgi:cytochrome d ubiquinol oxidase subunit II
MDLQAIWFFLWGLLWAVFFMTAGFDFGIGTLLPFMGKTDEDKRTMIASLGPLWHGNQVWLITAGGVTFAAFPLVYAVMFSTLYSALMLVLFTLILRGVAIEFRSQER